MRPESALDPIRWARGYLAGMAGGFVRGNIVHAGAIAAIHLALKKGVSHQDIQAVLAGHGLVWSPLTNALSKLG